MENDEIIQLDGENLNTVEKFKYLDSTINNKEELECEITVRV
jgi:hypothetical protein